MNPKDIAGAAKPDLSLVPPTALMHIAVAMMSGLKYGPGNWREIPVEARSYCAAAMRHIANWLDGEECASDSHVHNLAHAAASLMIVLDAQINGTMEDNRMRPGKASEESERLRETVAHLAALRAAAEVHTPENPPPAKRYAWKWRHTPGFAVDDLLFAGCVVRTAYGSRLSVGNLLSTTDVIEWPDHYLDREAIECGDPDEVSKALSLGVKLKDAEGFYVHETSYVHPHRGLPLVVVE